LIKISVRDYDDYDRRQHANTIQDMNGPELTNVLRSIGVHSDDIGVHGARWKPDDARNFIYEKVAPDQLKRNLARVRHNPFEGLNYSPTSLPQTWSVGVKPFLSPEHDLTDIQNSHPLLDNFTIRHPSFTSELSDLKPDENYLMKRSWLHDMKNMSLDHLVNLYQPRNKDYTSALRSVDYVPGSTINYDLDIIHRPSESKIGHIQRSLMFEGRYGHDLPFAASNDSFFIDPNHMGKGIADDIYHNQENGLFRPLSSHPESAIRSLSNGTVGRYSWAQKGFDWADENERHDVLDSLDDFINVHKLGKGVSFSPRNPLVGLMRRRAADEWLRKNTGRSFDDLHHVWDVASLDDGRRDYPIKKPVTDMYDTNGRRIFIVPPEAHTGHLGKHFLIDHAPSYESIKYLHPALPHSKVSELWKQVKQRRDS
jgi:hypothetical protein